MEHLLVALWRAPDADVSTIVSDWAPRALADANVEALTVNVADTDQGPYKDGNPVDALIALGLGRAHDLDDVPERGALYAIAREVKVWRVDPRHPKSWDRTWPDGTEAPGVKMVSFVQRAEDLTHEQFVRHWTEQHAPLALKHHIGLANYTQNLVRRAYTPGGAAVDGIAELSFRSRDAFENQFYDSDEGRAAIKTDVKRFIMRPSGEAALMRELPLRTPR
jgi:uncharacterized protein (TIGR02118 family)